VAEFPASQHLKDLLTTHVGISGWQVEIGAMPSSPDKIIMISDTGGQEPNPKYLIDYPTCQVMVRGIVSGYLATFREAKAVKDLLLGVDAHDNEGDRIDGIIMNGDVGFIGRDETNRPLFTGNYALFVEPQVVGNSNRVAL
jgi:Bacteriophage minor capsid protein